MSAKLALSLMPEDDFRRAALPLFEEGVVDAIEWSFDVGWGPSGTPAWIEALLDHYAAEGCLYGHGVHLSLLSARWSPRQERWMARFTEECARRRYAHVSEHFGFMTAGAFTRGAPLPVPRCQAAIALGRERLQRLADVARAPVGLENLALAFSDRDVEEQGGFLEALLADDPTRFLVLDVHNLWCQLANFGIDEEPLLASYPLERVRELHVSGGSWSTPASGDGRPFRRDTHDDAVPEGVFALLSRVLPRCPNAEVVVLERLGGTLADEDAAAGMRADFKRLRSLVTRGGAES